jgi:hypothetical protein
VPLASFIGSPRAGGFIANKACVRWDIPAKDAVLRDTMKETLSTNFTEKQKLHTEKLLIMYAYSLHGTQSSLRMKLVFR